MLYVTPFCILKCNTKTYVMDLLKARLNCFWNDTCVARATKNAPSNSFILYGGPISGARKIRTIFWSL